MAPSLVRTLWEPDQRTTQGGTVEVNLLSLEDMFDRTIRYVVPPFQRRYVWTEEEQWQLLWDDLRRTAEARLSSLAATVSSHRVRDADEDSHFLGAVVIQHKSTAVSEIRIREVIDGQQRLVTLQLLLSAMREVLRDFGHPGADRLGKLVENSDPAVQNEPNHRFKVWPTSGDETDFHTAMASRAASTDAEGTRIGDAWRFFFDETKSWIGDVASSHDIRIAALEDVVNKRLKMVVIELDEGENPHVIFETLNARGTPLLDWDLTKNYLMNRAAAECVDADALRVDHFADFDDDWWSEEVRQATKRRTRVDAFLNHWLMMRTAKSVEAKDVFPTLREWVADGPDGVTAVAADLGYSAELFREIEETESSGTVEGDFLYRWRSMQVRAITPLLLRLFCVSVPRTAFERSIRALESYLVRRMICGMTTRGYHDLMFPILEEIKSTDDRSDGTEPQTEVDEIVIRHLVNLKGERYLWPDNDRLFAAFLHDPLYDRLPRGRLRMVLEGIEGDLRTEKADSGLPRGKLTIEHVMPKQWRDHWGDVKAKLGDEDEDPLARRDRLVHSIGNLTLVHRKLNAAMSNAGLADKRAALDEHSTLFLNKDLLRHSRRGWDEDSIARRARRLWQAAVNVWPQADKI